MPTRQERFLMDFGPPPQYGGGYYPERGLGTLQALLMQRGRSQAEASLRSGDIWANTLGNIGQTLAGGIQQYGEEKKAKARDKAWADYVEGGTWANNPKEAYITANKIGGPDLAQKWMAGLAGVSQLSQEKRDPKADTEAMVAMYDALASVDEQTRARQWAQAVPIMKHRYPDLPFQPEYSAQQWILAGKAVEQLRPADEYTLNQGDKRFKGSQVIAENPKPAEPKAETRSLDVQAADALARGDQETYTRLLKVKKEMGQADDRPRVTVQIPGQGLSEEALDMAADLYARTGQMPAMGMGAAGAGVRQQIMNRAAQRAPGADIAGNKAAYGADTGSLRTLQKQTDAVAAFENTATANAKMLDDLAKKIPDLGTSLLNAPARSLAGKLGSEDMAAFNTIRQSVANEYARIISNPNLSGTMSDSARHEASVLLDPNATVGQIRAALKTLAAEAKNRHKNYQDQLGEIRDRMSGKKPGKASRFKIEVE